jgi:hypothetical protein
VFNKAIDNRRGKKKKAIQTKKKIRFKNTEMESGEKD